MKLKEPKTVFTIIKDQVVKGEAFLQGRTNKTSAVTVWIPTVQNFDFYVGVRKDNVHMTASKAERRLQKLKKFAEAQMLHKEGE